MSHAVPRWFVLLAALGIAAPAPAWSAVPAEAPTSQPEELFQRAVNAFRFGDYEQAVTLLDGLLTPRVLLRDSSQVQEALQILGVANHLTGNLPAAREAFMRLLNLAPDHRLDPLIVPPQVIEFFEGVRRELEGKLRELRRRQEWERLEAERLARERAPVRVLRETVRVDTHPYWMNFLPFGLGQWELGRANWGWFFLASQAGALATNVAAATAVEVTRNPDGTHSGDDLRRARDIYQPLQVASLVAFGVLMGWSVADGLVHWRPEERLVVRNEEELLPGNLAPPPPPSPPPSPPPAAPVAPRSPPPAAPLAEEQP